MGRRILVADDSVTIRKVVELTFSDEDFQITAVGDGLQALESARAERPDVVMSDVSIPGINGYELCERMKADASLRSVPFLLLRGTFERFDEERAGACGADGVIVKPFEAQEMVRRVKDLMAAAAAVSVLPARPAPPPPPAVAPPVPAPVPPPPPPPVRPVVMTPAPPSPFADEDFDFGPAEPAPQSAAGPDDDLWSEVSLRGATPPITEAAGSEDNFWRSLADETVLERNVSSEAGIVPRVVQPVPAAPSPAVDPAEIERIVASRLEAAVRQALEPFVAGMARPILEEIAWQVVPELAEAMIRAEIERVARSTDSG